MVTEQEKDRALKLLNMLYNAKNEVEAEAAADAMVKEMEKSTKEHAPCPKCSECD